MPKTHNKAHDKAHMEKYVAALNKFGLLPPFDFTKKEKKLVKVLERDGEQDFLSLCDQLDLKPEKGHKIVTRLVDKGAVTFQNEIVTLTLSALNYLHTEKTERKSAKKFYKFVDTLSTKELEEFMKLVSSFEVNPNAPAPEEVEEEKSK